MDAVRFTVQDSMFALLHTYLKLNSRDVLADFEPTWNGDDRLILLDGVNFRLCNRLPGQQHEIPGINLTYYDEYPQTLRTNPPGFQRLMTIHVYLMATNNLVADDRILLKMQRRIDEALFGRRAPVIDFYADPPAQLGRQWIHWDLLIPAESWLEQTDLANTGYLHRAKNLNLFYDDQVLV